MIHCTGHTAQGAGHRALRLAFLAAGAPGVRIHVMLVPHDKDIVCGMCLLPVISGQCSFCSRGALTPGVPQQWLGHSCPPCLVLPAACRL